MGRLTTYKENDEPISGYRLTDFLGRGKYGEVWKAIDPAGRRVAIKFVDLTEHQTAMRELRAFTLLRNLDHPHLIPIFTARLKDRNGREVEFDRAEEAKQKGTLKELIIAMGLGEKSLAARLKELNPDGTPSKGRRGMPVPELIGYMEGVAKGIDFLNKPDHKMAGRDGPIIHREIKPDNLFVVANEAKIADFGLALVVTPDATKTQVGGTGTYSPPELMRNQPTLGTDQYSLAVTYYELRTGRLPFPEGMSAYQLMFVHVEGRLDFSSPLVNEEERKALRKATAMNPKDRFENCTRFVKALTRSLADQLDGSIILQEPRGGLADLPRLPPRAAPPARPTSSPNLEQTYIPPAGGERNPLGSVPAPPSARVPLNRPAPVPPPIPVGRPPVAPPPMPAAEVPPPPPRPKSTPDYDVPAPPRRGGPPSTVKPAPWKASDPNMPAAGAWKGGVSRSELPPPGQVPDWRQEGRPSTTGPALSGLPRRANVRYYSRMAPDRAFPFQVVVSAEELQQAVQGAIRTASSAGFTIDPETPLDVEPVLPGCDVSPPRETIHVGQDPASCTFYVVPRVLGPVRGARVVVRQNNRAVAEVALDIKVAKPTLAWVLGGLGVMASPLGVVAKEAAGLSPMAVYAGLGVGLAFVAAGAIAYLLLRPKQQDAFFGGGGGSKPSWAN